MTPPTSLHGMTVTPASTACLPVSWWRRLGGIKCQSVSGQPEEAVEDKAKAISIMKALAARG